MLTHKMNPTDALNFLFGGKATLTVRNTNSSNRFTYQVKRAKGNNPNRPYFVSVMTGTDNETSFTYLGTIFDEKNFVHGKKSRINKDADSYKVFEWLFGKLLNKTSFTTTEVWHEGCCARCGRKLTVPESIEHGYGPECFKFRVQR